MFEVSAGQALDRTWYSLAYRATRYGRDGNASRDGTPPDTGAIDERPNGMAMSSPGTTRLRFEPDRTMLASGAARDVAIAVGAGGIAEQFFRHDPPTPLELEQAIDAVEDALAAAGLAHAARGELLIDAPLLLGILDLQAEGDHLGREGVEAIFQRLASASLGQTGLLAGLPPDRDAAAALLILRECMHHLGFEAVRRGRV